MRSLQARVAVAAAASVAIALLLFGSAVVTLVTRDERLRAPPAGVMRSPEATAAERSHRPGVLIRRRASEIGLLSLVAAGAVGWGAAGVALRPLARLRAAAERVAGTADLNARVPEQHGVVEVDELAAGLNEMLTRLELSALATESALAASRRFAADAGHELRTPLTSMQANLGALVRNPGLAAVERAALLTDVAAEQARLAALLDALQALARGDAGALTREPLDLADLVDAAVASAQARHPSYRIAFVDPGEAVPVSASPEGLRILLDNLLENGVRHGRDGGEVRVSLCRDGQAVELFVDDDGPGIPADERARVLQRFVRGNGARGPGSGLGLALVAQQASLHGGSVRISDAPLGGARVQVRLPG